MIFNYLNENFTLNNIIKNVEILNVKIEITFTFAEHYYAIMYRIQQSMKGREKKVEIGKRYRE